MNILRKLDNKLISAHQWVLDKTQVEPATAVKWCWRGVAMLTAVKCAIIASAGPIDGMDYLMASLYLLALAVVYFMYFRIASSAHAHLMLYRVMLVVVAFIPSKMDSAGVASLVSHIIYLAGLYFIMCDKPKPPHRKTQQAFA